MNKYLLWLGLSLCLANNALAADTRPKVRMSTSLGEIVLQLDAKRAPKTVANFLRYVEAGFYSGTIFHRVIDGFMIQGGGWTEDLERKTTFPPVQNEADNGLKNLIGTIAMARTSEPHSATAQFFINVNDNHFLNHRDKSPRGWGYTVFGRIVQGVRVVDKIRQVKTVNQPPLRQDAPSPPIVIKKVSIIR